MKPEETSGLLILLINILFTFTSSCFRSHLLIILLKGSKILASLGEFTLLQMSYSKCYDERCVYKRKQKMTRMHTRERTSIPSPTYQCTKARLAYMRSNL